MNFRGLVDGVLDKCMAVFGEEIIFYPKAGGIYKIKGVFDQNFQVIDVETQQVISGNQPAIGVNLNDLPIEIRNGDEAEFRGVRYKVQEKKEDGQGGAVFLVHAIRTLDANKNFKSSKI